MFWNQGKVRRSDVRAHDNSRIEKDEICCLYRLMMQLEAEGTYMIRPSVDSSSKVTQRRHERSGAIRGATTFSKLGVQWLGVGYCTEQNTDGIPSFVHCRLLCNGNHTLHQKSWGGPSNFFFFGGGGPDPPTSLK